MVVRESYNPDIFTKRQLEVLCLLSKGYSNSSIAKSLFLGRKSVENYVNAIYQILFPNLTKLDRFKIHTRVLTANYFNIYSGEMQLLLERFRESEKQLKEFQAKIIQDMMDNIIDVK